MFVIYFDTETGGVLPEQPTIQLAAVAIDQNGDEAGAFEQNIVFNLPRLKAMFGASFFPCEYLVRDVLQRALFFFDETQATKPENFKLKTLAAYFGIPTDGAHGALADARMCAKLHQAIREAF